MRAKLSANYLALVLFVSGVFLTKEAHAQGRTPNPPPINTNPDIESVGAAMDELASRAEEWGTLHMSAPLLIEPSTNFNFNLQRGASNYFSEAKSEIQAATAAALQQVQSFNLALQVQNMPGLTNSVTSINSSNLPNSAAILGTNANATTVFSSPGFTAPLGLLAGLGAPSPTLNNTAALDIAAADQTTEAIFRLFGDPEKAAQYAGRKILFGTVTVSVNPGYRTKQDYVADLGVLPRFDYKEARSEIVRRWLQGTNLTDEIRVIILKSYDLTSDADLISKIPWIGEHDPFDKLKTTISDLNDLKAKIATVDEALKTAKDDAFKNTLNSASPKPPPKKGPSPAAAPRPPSAKETEPPARTPVISAATTPEPGPVPAQPPSAPVPADSMPLKIVRDPVPILNISPESWKTDCFDDKSDKLRELRRCLSQEYIKAEDSYESLLGKLADCVSKWTQSIPEEMMDTNQNQPLAMAVSPLADLDVTDEGSSQRNQGNLALSLAGLLQKSGLQAQAAAFEQYAKRVERDSHTRTALPVVNTYGDGGLFGWEIGPRFRAMKDPGVKDSGVPANILDRQTFPALIMVGFNQEDFNPRLRRDCGKVKVLEPYLVFHTVPRWLRIKDCGWGRLWQKRYAETAILYDSARVNLAYPNLNKLLDDSTFKYVGSMAKSRIRALAFDVFGNDTGQLFDLQQVAPLPDASPTPPTIAGVYPLEIRLEPDALGNPKPAKIPFAILGNNLKSVVSVTKAVGGVKDIQFSPSKNNNLIQFIGTVTTNEPIVFQFAANSTNNAGVVTTNYVFGTNIVRVTFHKPKDAPESIVQTVETLPSATNSIGEYAVKIAPHADAESVKAALSIIINEINKAKPQDNANVSVQVQAEQKK